MKILHFFNPEQNPRARAVFYTIGLSGILHLIVITVAAPVNQDTSILNPFSIVGIDELIPALGRGVMSMIIGWAIFVLTIVVLFRVIRNKPVAKSKSDQNQN